MANASFISAAGVGTTTYVSSANPLPVTATITPSGTQNVNVTQIGSNAVVTGGVNGSQGVGGLAASGAALAGNPVLIAGSNGTNATTLSTDSAGHLAVFNAAAPSTITASSGNVANAAAVATLAAVAGKTTCITGFQCTAGGITALGSIVNITVTGCISGTMTYTFAFPIGALLTATPLIVSFPSPIPASATNTAIVVTLPAGGAGNTNAAVSAQGFQL